MDTEGAREWEPAGVPEGVGRSEQASARPSLPGPGPLSAAAPAGVEALTAAFYARPAAQVAPDLVGCRLVRRLESGALLRGLVVETEAYAQDDPGCHGHRRRSASNETLFGPPARFYVYLSHGVHHCVNVVTDRDGWASGVLLRAAALPDEPDRIAAGPALLARRFGIDRANDRQPVAISGGLWLEPRPQPLRHWWDEQHRRGLEPLVNTTRIGLSRGQELPWRWYLQASRSVSRRARGDRTPSGNAGLGLPLLRLVTGREGRP